METRKKVLVLLETRKKVLVLLEMRKKVLVLCAVGGPDIVGHNERGHYLTRCRLK